MDWPSLSKSSIKDEIDSISLSSEQIIVTSFRELDIPEHETQKINKLLKINRSLMLIQATAPSIKALFLLRYLEYLRKIMTVLPPGNKDYDCYIMEKRVFAITSLLESIKATNLDYTLIEEECKSISSFTMRILNCRKDRSQCINVLYDLKTCGTTFSLVIDSKELSSIPIPSFIQIQKDLQRESFIINGLAMQGSKGISSVRDSIESVFHTFHTMIESPSNEEMENIIDRVISSISRTRIGEYCYNTLLKLFPVENATLLLKVDNMSWVPIELQIASKVFKLGEAWKWGICVSMFFSFRYNIIDINDVSSQHDVIIDIDMKCQSNTCFGLMEYAGYDYEDHGVIHISLN